MVSHLDTVFPPEEEARNHFHWQAESDRIYGPGTHDIKGGTVMEWLMLQALQVLAPAAFQDTTWKLFWNSSEETLARDFGDVCRERLDNDTLAALIFEGEGRLGGERLVVVARKGRATWRVTATGRGAHAGAKHSAVNRPNWFTPSRLLVKLLIPTIRRSSPIAAGMWCIRNSVRDASCMAARLVSTSLTVNPWQSREC